MKSRAPIIPVFYKVKPHPVPEFADLVDRLIKVCVALLLSLKVIGALVHPKQLGTIQDRLNIIC